MTSYLDQGQVIYRITNGVAMLVGRNQLSIQALRDNPDCANEFDVLQDAADPGLNMKIGFSLDEAPYVSTSKPKVAILREQG